MTPKLRIARITTSLEDNGKWWVAIDTETGNEITCTRYGYEWCAKITRQSGYQVAGNK